MNHSERLARAPFHPVNVYRANTSTHPGELYPRIRRFFIPAVVHYSTIIHAHSTITPNVRLRKIDHSIIPIQPAATTAPVHQVYTRAITQPTRHPSAQATAPGDPSAGRESLSSAHALAFGPGSHPAPDNLHYRPSLCSLSAAVYRCKQRPRRPPEVLYRYGETPGAGSFCACLQARARLAMISGPIVASVSDDWCATVVARSLLRCEIIPRGPRGKRFWEQRDYRRIGGAAWRASVELLGVEGRGE